MRTVYKFSSYFDQIYRMALKKMTFEFWSNLAKFHGHYTYRKKTEPSILLDFFASFDRSRRNMEKTYKLKNTPRRVTSTLSRLEHSWLRVYTEATRSLLVEFSYKGLEGNFQKDVIEPTLLKCKNGYLVLALGEETSVQAVVGSIVWTLRRLKKPSCQEMSPAATRFLACTSKFPSFPLYGKFDCISRVGCTLRTLNWTWGDLSMFR